MVTATAKPGMDSVERPYEPYGGVRDLFAHRSWDGEFLMSGPAGTGKTTGILNLLWWYAGTYDGMRGLIIRKTRESLTESVLATWEKFVVPENHPCLQGASRATRRNYVIGNSEIVVAGMKASGRDMTQNVMSTDYDVIVAFEAIELTEEEWEKLTTRLRHGRMPNQLIIADTNPAQPRHWLKLRCNRGQTKLIESRHEDNPLLWDSKTGTWTNFGRKYIAKLDSLTGARRARLRHGLWVQAEGAVYESFDPAVHVIDYFEPPFNWPRFWSIDFGYTNPFVCGFFAQDEDGRLYLYREVYHTGLIVEDAAKQLLTLVGAMNPDTGKRDWSKAREPRPKAVVCDHDAEDRATIERHLGIKTTAAKKDVVSGIQAVEKRLRKAGDGKPRLFIMQGTLVARDPELEDAKKPCCTAEEFDGYVWADKETKEEPVKVNDHGVDMVRYMVMHFDAVEGILSKPHHRMAQPNGQAQVVPVRSETERLLQEQARHQELIRRNGREYRRRLVAAKAGGPPVISGAKAGASARPVPMGLQFRAGSVGGLQVIGGNVRRGANGGVP